MKIKVLASGSKGNCTILLCDNTNIIIDMGISYLTLKRSLEENNLAFNDFSGVLLTHCHSDHTKGLASLIKNTTLPLYIPKDMYDSIKELVPYAKCHFIDDIFSINDVVIELIHTSHDAPSSVGFIISHQEKSIVYITDTGYINRKYLNKMLSKDAYIIECNHDERMLMDGPYPRYLKERVISDKGHLSNNTTAQYLKKIVSDKTKQVILAHLSETNNTEEKAYEAVSNALKDKNIIITVAKQYEATQIIEV